MSAPKPCPGCGREWSHCTSAGDECWRNSGCPKQPPNPPLPDYIADAKPAPSVEPGDWSDCDANDLKAPLPPVAAPCAGCAAANAELERRTAWSNNQIALLLRRLRFRNETIAFLTKSKLSFDESGTPQGAADLLYFTWWQETRKQARFHADALFILQREYLGVVKRMLHFRDRLALVGYRLHIKRAEAAHWMQATECARYAKRFTMTAYRLNRAALERVEMLIEDSLDPRHGPGGRGIYAAELRKAIDG